MSKTAQAPAAAGQFDALRPPVLRGKVAKILWADVQPTENEGVNPGCGPALFGRPGLSIFSK
jgi:hypothetical protein